MEGAGWPIWYELMTPDAAAVGPFYSTVLGWGIPASGHVMPNGAEYREIVRSDGGHIGGMLTLSPEMIEQGVPPAWVTYFNVADVDAAVAKAVAMGATVQMPATTMDGVGRMAMIGDPQGASLYLMAPTPPPDRPDAKSDVFDAEKVGRCAWNELSTDQAEQQIEFYTSLFGWTVNGEMPMPGDHTYQFLECDGQGIGAIGSLKPDGARSTWMPYFRVAGIGAAAAAVSAQGGTVLQGPHEVPGNDTVLVVADPVGALLGLVAKRSE